MNITLTDITSAIERAADALLASQDELLRLDQAMGDGDLGISMAKIATALREYAAQTTGEVDAGPLDLGKWLASADMAANRAGSSSMGTLLATALMRAGKEARGLSELTPGQLAAMLSAAEAGVRERGKASLGDKTVVDALHPAAGAFAQAIAEGVPLAEAGRRMVAAAEAGRDRVTPLQSKIGRASWVGERTAGLVDPGCQALVVILRALVG